MNTLTLLSLLAATLLLAVSVPMAQAAIDPVPAGRRVLILFARANDDAQLVEQRKRFGDHAVAMRERDITLIEVIGDTVRRDGEALDASAAELRRRQKVEANAFAVHLIGKDGGTKLRREKPVEMKEIADLIDSMPMRQQEMQERQ